MGEYPFFRSCADRGTLSAGLPHSETPWSDWTQAISHFLKDRYVFLTSLATHPSLFGSGIKSQTLPLEHVNALRNSENTVCNAWSAFCLGGAPAS